MRVNTTSKYKKTLSFFISNKAYLGQDFNVLNKSIHSFILGKRNNYSYYNLHFSLLGVKNSLEILENIVSQRGDISFVGGDTSINSILLCLSNLPQSNIFTMPWDFSHISRSHNFDLLLLHEVNSISQLESYNKLRPYIGINCSTTKDLSYLFNLNLQDQSLLNWYLYVLMYSCRRGLYFRKKKKKNEI